MFDFHNTSILHIPYYFSLTIYLSATHILLYSTATGIARSVTPGQALRGVTYVPNIPPTSGESAVPSETQVNYSHFHPHSTLI